MLSTNYRCVQKPAFLLYLQKCLSESRPCPLSIPFSTWTCHNPDTIQGLFIASVKTPGQSRTVMESLLSLVSPHSAAELSPDPSLTSARRQQLLKEMQSEKRSILLRLVLCHESFEQFSIPIEKLSSSYGTSGSEILVGFAECVLKGPWDALDWWGLEILFSPIFLWT